MARGALRRTAALLISVLTIAASAGCGGPGEAGNPQKPQLERTVLRVGVLPVVDVAALRLAMSHGVFDGAGLRVELVDEGSEQDALHQLDTGRLDVAFAGDVTLFKAAAAGTPLELEGAAYQAGPNTMALVTGPGSHYTDPAQKPAPRIAVDSLTGIGVLVTKSVLSAAGIDPMRIRWVRRSFSDMPGALANGEVDAAWMVEPYITLVQKQRGAQVLTDAATGATLNFPISAYATTKRFAAANPATLETFRIALAKAQEQAADRGAVQDILRQNLRLDPATAALVSVGTYPDLLSVARLQRVADMMQTAGMLPNRLDVGQLVPAGTAP